MAALDDERQDRVAVHTASPFTGLRRVNSLDGGLLYCVVVDIDYKKRYVTCKVYSNLTVS